MADDTFDAALFGEDRLEQPKLPPLRTFKVNRPGKDDLVIEAHAIERDGTAVGFVVIEFAQDGVTPFPRIRHLVISPEMEVAELIEFRAQPSRIL